MSGEIDKFRDLIHGMELYSKNLSHLSSAELEKFSGLITDTERKVSAVSDEVFKASSLSILEGCKERITDREIEILTSEGLFDDDSMSSSGASSTPPSVDRVAARVLGPPVPTGPVRPPVSAGSVRSSGLADPYFHIANAYNFFMTGNTPAAFGELSALAPSIQEKISNKLATLIGCKPEEAKAFLRGEASFGISIIPIRLAIRLSMTPTIIFAAVHGMEQIGNAPEAARLFSLLPPKLQKEYIDMVSDAAKGRLKREVAVGEITAEDKMEVAGPFLEKASLYEQKVEDVAAVQLGLFRAIDKNAGISPESKLKEKEKLIHTLAQAISFLDGKPFVKSTEKELGRIIQDYNSKYPAIPHSLLMYQFYPYAAGR